MAITEALERNNGRIFAAVRELGIDKNILPRKLIGLHINGEKQVPE